MQSTNLIFISSPGHSGSTILDLALGQLNNTFSTGELKYLSWQLKRPERHSPSKENENICSCGQSFENCEFWPKLLGKVYGNWTSSTNFNLELFDSNYYEQPKDRHVTILYSIYRKLISHTYGKTPILLLSYLLKSNAKQNWKLLDSISQKSQSEYIIDSSKDLVRFHALYKERPYSCQLIIIKRDLTSLVHSAIRRNRCPRQACYRWLRYYQQAFGVIKNYPQVNYKIISYEDFCQSPENIINSIKSSFNLNVNFLNSLKYLSPKESHLVAGNPIRLKDSLIIKLDERYKTKHLSRELINLITRTKNQYDGLAVKLLNY